MTTDSVAPLPLVFSGTESAPDPRDWLSAIIAGSDDAIISKNLEGNIQSWNASATRLFGYTAEEVGGRSRSAPGANLEQAVDDRLRQCRSPVEDESEEADEHDAPDELGEPGIERGGLQGEPDGGNPDLDSGEDPEQRPRRIRDCVLPALGRCHHLVFQGGEHAAVGGKGGERSDENDNGGTGRRSESRVQGRGPIDCYHRGLSSWPPVRGGAVDLKKSLCRLSVDAVGCAGALPAMQVRELAICQLIAPAIAAEIKLAITAAKRRVRFTISGASPVRRR